jgi:excisionase family DNA binding protein
MSNQHSPIITAIAPQLDSSDPLKEEPVGSREAGHLLRMHPKTVLRKAREGILPAHPVGSIRKRWRFYLSELNQWLRSQVLKTSQPRRGLQGHVVRYQRLPADRSSRSESSSGACPSATSNDQQLSDV